MTPVAAGAADREARRPRRWRSWRAMAFAIAGLAGGLVAAEAAEPRLKGLDDHPPGPRGGAIADAGPYHIELVFEGSTLSVRLYDSNVKLATGSYGEPLPVGGVSAEAVLLINSAKETLKLAAGDAVTLVAKSAAEPDGSMKAVIRLQAPDQRPLQARFVPIAD